MPAPDEPRATPSGRRAPPAEGPSTLVVGASIDPADASTLCRSLSALLERKPGSVVDCDVSALARADLGAVDVLARLQLTAKRCGCSIRLRNPSIEMLALIDLIGLGDVLPLCAPLSLEAKRQTEHRIEPLGVQEERDP